MHILMLIPMHIPMFIPMHMVHMQQYILWPGIQVSGNENGWLHPDK